MIEIALSGNIPSKKNMLKMTKSGHGYYDAETRASLNDLAEQVAKQWSRLNKDGNRVSQGPLLHPAIAVVFYVVSERSDKDNKYTTVLDALVAGGVMKDDCIALCDGPVLLLESVKTKSAAGAKIFLEPSGSLDDLLGYVRKQNFKDYEWLKVIKSERKAVSKRRLKKA